MSDTKTPNLFDAIKPQTATEGDLLLQTGEAAIVFSPDGSFRIVAETPENATAEQDFLGSRLMTIAFALSNDQIMSMLTDITRRLIAQEASDLGASSH